MSRRDPLTALVDAARVEGGDALLLAPAVGILRGIPPPGRMLAPGETFARVTILGVSRELRVPEGLSGVVSHLAVDGFGADAVPVEYGQPLLTLAPIDAGKPGASPATSGAVASRGSAALESLPPGCHAIPAPADGVFYRRPRPSDPAYVEVGDRVHAGQTLALIEAMKCFSAIGYGGAGLPEEAEVVEIRGADASEVRHGQVLFVVR
ncbi:MAG: hypothetical protein HY049_07170 [Acidobacteria bacterium]|nr:hypothetical protein [Acidobacteriota bacterium]